MLFEDLESIGSEPQSLGLAAYPTATRVRIEFAQKRIEVLVEVHQDKELHRSTTAQHTVQTNLSVGRTLRHAGPEIRMIAIAALPGAVDKAKMVEPVSIPVLVGLVLECRLIGYSVEFGNMSPRNCRHRLAVLEAKRGRLVKFCGA